MWRVYINFFNFVILIVPIVFFVAYNTFGYDLCTTKEESIERSEESLLETSVLEKGIDILSRIRFHITPPSAKDVPYGPKGFRHPLGEHADYRRMITQIMWKYGLTKPGYFVEAGASHEYTLDLERYLGWDGLLIEPSVSNLENINLRERKAWVANVCLSNESHLEVNFALRKNQAINWKKKKAYLPNIHLSSDPVHAQSKNKKVVNDTECFQLHSVLHAANTSRVDLLVLEAEGYEYKILNSFPYDEFPIKVIAVDIRSMPEPNYLLSEAMVGKGYRVVYDHNNKYFIFLHNNVAPVGAL